ncbi:MAG: hypothetical protein LDL41_17115 [Coleofasciculus sp. S288]|nr:hypothetical protein [Coleofasciculus sp. S288]
MPLLCIPQTGAFHGISAQKYEKTTQIPDFFVETLMPLNEFDSEVGNLPKIPYLQLGRMS